MKEDSEEEDLISWTFTEELPNNTQLSTAAVKRSSPDADRLLVHTEAGERSLLYCTTKTGTS